MTIHLIKIRLIGTREEVAESVKRIRTIVKVRNQSPQYPCRHNPAEVRVYIEAEMTTEELIEMAKNS